jgi:hypothetical protein
LKEIKIVDPAVGSGAFPIGMMNEIVKARSILTIFFDEEEQKKRSVYKLKREAIENSLYGVDIDSSAVDIAKLRFWLSLIVDEQDIKNIKPLPNLDHKIMCGNSLLEEFEGVKLFDEKLLVEIPKDYSYQLEQIDREVNKLNQELHDIHTGKGADNGRTKQIQRELKNLKREKEQILAGPNEDVPQVTLDEAFQKRIKESQKKLNELKELQKKFFNEQNRKLKRQYAEEIDRIEWELIEETLKEEGNEEAMLRLEQYKKNKSKPFFLWKLYFSELFQRDNPGFDVVIANPPYFNIRKDLKLQNQCKSIYPEIYNGQNDILYYFVTKGLQILRKEGVLTHIISRYFLEANSANKFRNYILNNSVINEIIDFGNNQLFEEADILNVIISLKHNVNKSNIAKIYKFEKRYTPSQIIEEINNKFTKNYANKIKRSQELMDENIWIFLPPKIKNLVEKIESKSFPLQKIAKTGAGIQSGLNSVFVVDEKTIGTFGFEHKILRNYCKTRDIKSYFIINRNLKVIRLTNNEDIANFQNTKKYLLKYKDQLEKRYEAKKKLCKWYAFSVARNLDIFDSKKEKIITPIYSTTNKFGYDSANSEQNYLTLSDTAVIQITNERYNTKVITGLLNSGLMDFYYKKIESLKEMVIMNT